MKAAARALRQTNDLATQAERQPRPEQPRVATAPGHHRGDFDGSYTARGGCPPGFVVVPNHRSLRLRERRAWFHGVSVNADRGIACGDGEEGDSGFNFARGRLLLHHDPKGSLSRTSAAPRARAPAASS